MDRVRIKTLMEIQMNGKAARKDVVCWLYVSRRGSVCQPSRLVVAV